MPGGMYYGDAPLTQSEHRSVDQAMETTANVRTAILEAMTPQDIAIMLQIFFDDKPEGFVEVFKKMAEELKTLSPTQFYSVIDPIYKSGALTS
jgi:hypothetical protein